jgi:hypothetical protein
MLLLGGMGYLAYKALVQQNGTPSVMAPIKLPQISLPSLQPTVTNAAGKAAGLPLGVRNNNPTNIKASLVPWKGQNGQNAGFATFMDPQHGIRAAFKNLRSYQETHKLNTIAKIEKRWTATDQGAWARNVAAASGLGVNDILNSRDFVTQEKLVRGIIAAENGGKYESYYSPAVFYEAWSLI